ncbi:hypothetical protein D3C84_873020 [compost metagenome]
MADGEYRVLASDIEQFQPAQCSIRRGYELRQQVLQIGRKLRDLSRTETRRVVAEIEIQRLAQLDAKGQRIVGAFVVVQVTERQPGRRALLQRFGDGEVFEHQQTVKQRSLIPRPPLNVVQRHVLEFA